MIDTEKMKALAAKLRKYTGSGFVVDDATEAADAIDTLLAALESSDQRRKEAVLDAEKARDERNRIHVKLNAEWIEKTADLRAALEAAAADKRDALQFHDLLDAVIREIERGKYDRPYRGIENAPDHGHAVPGIWDPDNGAKAGTQCAWCATWNAARLALSQRQEES